MKNYIYPQNLNAVSDLWLWSMKDLLIHVCAILISVVVLAATGWILPLVATMVYAFITIRLDDITIKDYLGYVFRFLFGQRTFFWR